MKPRALEFDDFDDISREADRLLKHGYDTAGNWDLAQVCNHLTGALTRSISTGVRPMVSLPVRWYLKWRYLDKVLRSRRLPSGVKAPESLRSPPSGDAATAVQRLHEAITEFKAYKGEFRPHPYFGRLTPEQARQFHLIHCAHHCRFLLPVQEVANSR